MVQRSLEGKVALVTGASRGIGRAIAMELSVAGAQVALNYRVSEEEARAVAEQISSIGGTSILVKADVSSGESARRLIRDVVDHFGRLDILVNNAGITRDRKLYRLSDEDWLDVVNTNLSSAFYCTSAAIPMMIEQGFGRIINISSVIGQSGNVGQANYAAAKGGLISFTKSAALELARHNITVNAIAPGFTETDMLAKVPADIREQIRAKIPLGRFGSPIEIAKVAWFLAAHGDYITGQEININGGLHV
ncbi:MAG: 3-oxoacyl-[acyl-carrier-protein] reductase [Chloroflexi bacterium]|nr:3-oxoacyl-[acyl-carrier-protein] reductase [Chloroflexota bacterium]